MMAAYYGNLDIVSLLLDKGASIEAAGQVSVFVSLDHRRLVAAVSPLMKSHMTPLSCISDVHY